MAGKKIIVCDMDKCAGCELCEYACSIYKDGEINWNRARIRHIRIEPIFDIAITCRKCESPECLRACPREAISVLGDSSVMIDGEKCNGCGWCVEACDFGAMRLDERNDHAYTCDFCAEFEQPKCVEVCPFEALEFTTLDQVSFDKGKKALMRVIQEKGAG